MNWTPQTAWAADKGGGKAEAGGGGGLMGIARAGAVELSLSGLYDADPDESTTGYLNVALGYFMFDGIELGLSALLGTTRDGQRDTRGVFAEYDYRTYGRYVPFAGGAIKHYAPPVNSDGNDARSMAAYGGVKLILSGAAAIAATLEWEQASHAVIGKDGERQRRNREVNMSIKLFF